MQPATTMYLPASSANLGPALDSAALALNFGLQVRASVADTWRVKAAGRDAGLCQNLKDHLIVESYCAVLQGAGRPVRPLALELDNAIPIGKGCGSSAAARLAGVALAARFGDLAWDANRVFEAAVELEGHPDNVAACWWGGLVLARSGPGAATTWLRVPLTVRWPLLLAVPHEALATSQSRSVLPRHYDRADVVHNLQTAGLLVQALQQGRGDLLPGLFADRLHQPYRSGLCPLLQTLAPLAGREGVAGCALSGAGPSVLLVLQDERHYNHAVAAAEHALRAAGLRAELLRAEIESLGPGQEWLQR